MNVIRILSENVASQIAAGEVVDRPASVVRELIDNSIDAGADRITLMVEKGGKGLIRVSDNGMGMSRDDLLLCIERHATSKIETASDLHSVKTLGFRGEAIPSIAAVSRMQITSRPKDRIEGYRIRISGGKLTGIEETGSPAGTVVEVKDLFFNLPARRKFLRAPGTEMDHIVDILSRMVLPYPAINFRLEDSGKTILNFPSSDQMISRLFALMGRNVAEAMVEAEEKGPAMSVRAFLAPPELSRSRGDRLFVYINGRNLRDRLITRAMVEGYGQRLMKGHYPQAALFMELDPSHVDVNVHPAKQEVRFHDTRAVFQAIVAIIQRALSQSFHPFFSRDKDIIRHDQGDGSRYVPEPAPVYFKGAQAAIAPSVAEIHEQPWAVEKAYERLMFTGGPEVIGQLGNTYILCQGKDGLMIVDQHAAHERVVYENLKKGIDASHMEVQNLLLPYHLELSVKETRIALKHGGRLSRIGIELAHFGGNTFLLRAHPAMLKKVQWELFFPELFAGLEEGEPGEEAVLERLLTVMACHGAVRAGDPMTREEMALLLRQLDDLDLPTNCPHGRPVFKHFTYHEIEKMFKRVV